MSLNENGGMVMPVGPMYGNGGYADETPEERKMIQRRINKLEGRYS